MVQLYVNYNEELNFGWETTDLVDFKWLTNVQGLSQYKDAILSK